MVVLLINTPLSIPLAMKPLFALVALLIPFCCPELLLAQSTESSFEKYRREKKAEFETFRREKKTEFEQYRQRLNEEYSRVLGSSWSTFREEKRKDPPMRPKPVTPFSARLLYTSDAADD